ncbi:ABC transporter ATP-binding protein [Candidatus Poriferisocius sp.]|uniref:ABC transporter ATP-binding protein n=1 Tax=Candidatus Poriferisocius sp. TaxID=3101276 RepID=UPI003B021992
MTDATTGLTGAGGSDPSAPAVELLGITKRFGGIVACDQVDLTLHRGHIHGILGENGAGKSTLMKVLIGLVLPDAGSVRIDGQLRTIHDPLAASALGIAMVHQHFSLVDQLSVWENVALGEEGRLKSAGVRDRVAAISRQYGLDIDPDARVGELTAGLRQRVEIIKCLRRDPHILVFDEPTSVLTPEESEQLFSTLREVVAAEGRAVVLVSHKLDEVLHATDEITIMRQGRVVDHRPTQEADARSLARAMVGREVSLRSERAAFGIAEIDDAEGESAVDSEDPRLTEPAVSNEPVMRIEGVTVRGRGGARLLDDISLELRAGEIVGVAGVEGNGQRTLGDLLSSLVPLDAGRVVVKDKEVPTGAPGAMAKAGVAVIPEDRHDSGVVLDMTVAENLLMVDPHRVARHGVMDKARTTETAQQMIEEFDIGCSGPDAPLWSLSGGNQQRVVLARELAAEPDVLVAAQPTRGLDVGAIEYMTDRLRQTAVDGVAVLLISSELEEILELADRILVMSRGRIAGELSHAEANLETLGLLMGGSEA